MKETLQLTRDEARDLIYGDLEGFEVIEKKQIDNSRWSIYYRLVVKRLSDEKFFAANFSRGATECQDEQPFEYNDPNFTEVFPVEKTIIVYE